MQVLRSQFFRARPLLRPVSSMSDALCAAFDRSLNLNAETAPEIDLSKYSELQQAQIQQWLTLSARFPSAFAELNDVLRDTTFLLGGQEASEVDALVLAKASKYLPELKEDEIIANRHVARWADLVQHVVGKHIFALDPSLAAPREVPKKEKKGDKADKKGDKKGDKKADKKDAKADKKSDKKADVAAAGAAAGAAGEAGAAAGAKKEKKEKKQKAPPAPTRPVTPGMIDLRVGFIEKAVKHPDADSLYVSTIHVGEDEPRTICSGLVKYIPIEDMQKRNVVVVANLKPVKMRGIQSNGMVLCASNKDDGVVEFIRVPEGASAGDKIFFEGFDEEPESVLNPKKKIWEQIQPDFSTDNDLNVIYKKDGVEHKLVNKKGEVLRSSTVKNANVS